MDQSRAVDGIKLRFRREFLSFLCGSDILLPPAIPICSACTEGLQEFPPLEKPLLLSPGEAPALVQISISENKEPKWSKTRCRN